MKRNWIPTLGLAAATALGALTLPALAHEFERGEGYGRMGERGGHGEEYGRFGARGEHGRGADQHRGMIEMMREMHGGMGSGMMGGPGMLGAGMMGGPGMMMGGMGPMADMMQAFDSDGDGTVTPDELHSGLEGRLAEFDADGSGTLSIDEFEALHSAMIREHMVDRFQHLDNDGDGEVTAEEMTAPADRFQRMQDLRTRMMEQRSGPAGADAPQAAMPMQDMDAAGGMMEGGMMDDDDMMQQGETAEPSGN